MQLVNRLSPGRSRSLELGKGFPVGQYKVSVSGSYEPVSQVEPPPAFGSSTFHVSIPGSPFAGTVQRRQTRSPVSALNAAMNPRIPQSPPETPAITRSFTISGAMVEP